MIALNVETISLFCLTYLFEKSALRKLSVCFALMTVRFMYCENVSFGSKVISKVFGCFDVDSVLLFKLSDTVVPYSAGSSTKSVILCKNMVV